MTYNQYAVRRSKTRHFCSLRRKFPYFKRRRKCYRENDPHGDYAVLGETGADFGVLRVEYYRNGEKTEEYEVATFRVDKYDDSSGDGRHPKAVEQTLAARIDATRRDMTVNALVYDPKLCYVVDYTGWLEDIVQRRLRFVGNPADRIAEDRLSALHFIRFAAKLDFTPDPASAEVIKISASEIVSLPKDRIREELEKMVETGKWAEVFTQMKELELLEHTMPHIDTLDRCEQGPPYHMEGNVWVHTILLLQNLRLIVENWSKENSIETTKRSHDFSLWYWRHCAMIFPSPMLKKTTAKVVIVLSGTKNSGWMQ